MFAPKLAKPQTKAAEASTSRLAPHRSSLVGALRGHDPVEQALFLQRTIENQATLRLLARRDSAPLGDGRDSGEEQQSVGEITPIETVPRGASWDFSKIPLFPPERVSRTQQVAVQPKLAIGPVDDPLEREADAVADRVMRLSSPTLSISPPEQISRKCASCENDEQDKKLQTKPARMARPASEVPPIVHAALRSPGKPLDAETRAYFEPRFGRDFSGVRVHAGSAAARSAQEVNAQAYTVGESVVFGSGQFAPQTHNGRRLLAHELTHVVQQSAAGQVSGVLQRQGSGSGSLPSSPPTSKTIFHPGVMHDHKPSGRWADIQKDPNSGF